MRLRPYKLGEPKPNAISKSSIHCCPVAHVRFKNLSSATSTLLVSVYGGIIVVVCGNDFRDEDIFIPSAHTVLMSVGRFGAAFNAEHRNKHYNSNITFSRDSRTATMTTRDYNGVHSVHAGVSRELKHILLVFCCSTTVRNVLIRGRFSTRSWGSCVRWLAERTRVRCDRIAVITLCVRPASHRTHTPTRGLRFDRCSRPARISTFAGSREPIRFQTTSIHVTLMLFRVRKTSGHGRGRRLTKWSRARARENGQSNPPRP